MALDYRFQLPPHLPRGYEQMEILNLGAGHCSSPISEQFLTLKCRNLTNVEVFRPVFNQLVGLNFASSVENVCEDIRIFVGGLAEGSYDVVIMLDVLEHFTKEDGQKILKAITRIARKGVCLFLPMKECPQDDYEGNPYQRHLSTWVAEEFPTPWVVEYYEEFHTHVDPPADAAWVMLYN